MTGPATPPSETPPRWLLWWMGCLLSGAVLLLVGVMAYAAYREPAARWGLGLGVVLVGPPVVYCLRSEGKR